jgi:fused signal recognition particle receptor
LPSETPVQDPASVTTEPTPVIPETPFERFFSGLEKTRTALGGHLAGVFASGKVDEALFTQLEEALIRSDVGVKTAMALIDRLKVRAHSDGLADGDALRQALAEELKSGLMAHDSALSPEPAEGPHVILVVGVNGSGKTTTIGKLSAHFKAQGKRVLLGAGDTFRAGAIAQLKIWADRRARILCPIPREATRRRFCLIASRPRKRGAMMSLFVTQQVVYKAKSP